MEQKGETMKQQEGLQGQSDDSYGESCDLDLD